jgi:hypothetical protein
MFSSGPPLEKTEWEPSMVAYAYNLSTQEAEAGGSQDQGQPGLHRKTLSQEIKQTNKQKKGKQRMV